MTNLNRDEIKRRLESVSKPEFRPLGRDAAVLIPLVSTPDGWTMVLTRRTEDLKRHRGEISFPGGMVDESEDTKTAALRETHEELGVSPDDVEILGKLHPVHTVVSGVLIDPWVGVLLNTQFDPNPSEIALVFEVPLAKLLDPDTYREQKFIRAGNIYSSPAYDVDEHIIWGATARIIEIFLETIG